MNDQFHLRRFPGGNAAILWRPSAAEWWHTILWLDLVASRGAMPEEILAALEGELVHLVARFESEWPDGSRDGELYAISADAGRVRVGHWLPRSETPFTRSKAREFAARLECVYGETG